MNVEQRVGAFFFVGLALLTGFTFLATDLGEKFRSSGAEYVVTFPTVGDLKAGDPVRYGGVPVGKVKTLAPDPESGRVRVTIEIERKYSDQVVIREGAEITIKQALLGGSHVAIDIGDPQAAAVVNGSEVRGLDPGDLSKAIQSVNEFLEELKGLPTDLKKLVRSFDKNQDRVMDALANILEENRKSFRKSVGNIETITTRLTEGKGTVGKLLVEEEAYDKLIGIEDRLNMLGDELLDLVKDNRARVDNIMSNVDKITEKVASGEGSIGEFVMKDDLSQQADITLKKLETAADEVTKFASDFAGVKTYLGVNSWTYRVTGHDGDVHKGRVFVDLVPPEKTMYVIGGNFYYNDPLRERGLDGVELDVQVGFRFVQDRLILRAGLLEGSLGGGIDGFLPDGRTKLVLEGRLEDDEVEVAEPFLLRAKVSYRVYRNLRIEVGGENLLDDPSYAVGIAVSYYDKYVKALFSAAP